MCKLITAIVPSALIISAIGYFMREIFRATSKVVIQTPMYKSIETYFPTTEFLLWKNNHYSMQTYNQLKDKIYKDFKIKLATKESEAKNEENARKLIAEAVKRIRDVTRDNVILFENNCSFGFFRNFLGGNLWAIFFTTIILIVDYFKKSLPLYYFIIGVAIEIFLFFLVFLLMKVTANAYANKLYTVYLETDVS